ncbi:MAG: hypothetical protein KAT53_07480, partial [Dehalococcoidia bacterium]|nr:hypothetical protein [Dehalococcoidia bacterium]
KSNNYNAGVLGAALVDTELSEITKVSTPFKGFVMNMAGLAFLIITWDQLLGRSSNSFQTTLTIIGGALSLGVIVALYFTRKSQIEKFRGDADGIILETPPPEDDAAADEPDESVDEEPSAEFDEAESPEEPVEEEEPTPLDADAADALLTESNLPDASRERLAKTEWLDESALTDAIAAEVAYVTELTGAGRPVGQEPLVVESAEEKSRDELLREKLDEVDRRHGVFRGKEEA